MSQTVGPIELPRNSRVVLLSLVPGLGHFYLDRFAMGSLLFAGFVTALNAWFLGSMLHSLENPELLRNVAGVTVVLIWAAGMYHAYRLSYGTDRVALAKERRELIRRALIHYLRDELEEARKLLAHAVDLDVDWVDPDPLFHLGVVLARLAERAALRSASEARGLRRRALSAFKACQSRDPDDKWAREIAVESRRLSRRESRRQRDTSSLNVQASLPLGGESTDMLPALAQLSQSGEHLVVGKALERALPETPEPEPEPELEAEAPAAQESDAERYPSESAAFRKLLFGDGKAPSVEVDLIDPEDSLPPNRPRSRRLTSRRLAKARLLERLESETELEAVDDAPGSVPPRMSEEAARAPTASYGVVAPDEAETEAWTVSDELDPTEDAAVDPAADAEEPLEPEALDELDAPPASVDDDPEDATSASPSPPSRPSGRREDAP